MKKILTVLALTATALAAFCAGRVTSQPTQPENLTRIEMAAESGGLYLSYTDDQDRFYDFWIPSGDLESVGLINVNSVKGWETWESAEEVGRWKVERLPWHRKRRGSHDRIYN